ncbi:hypothetical protein Mettu_3506 [Methylobacter tundripaludum SV96]|jgi:hypothetical protein|uniref:Uncharacterized protein n=2 Tax=Methylobacter tundripaludum TaxID=173365 RepID=G3IZK1_METTV|nr:hypothetical protein Mettu_3506 [Methylobacter tundripaludum SV96]PPK74632.1 hypothetical protein B0F87_108106 [Methylobacter tundripaludum]
MATRELTKQAFRLYDNIRAQSYRASACSEDGVRLYFLGRKAFYRYKRRLKAE